MKVLSVTMLIASLVSVAHAAGPEDVDWCLYGNANSTILQQPMRDYCPQVLAGAVVGAWYKPEYAGLVATAIQQDWAWKAAELSCSGDPVQQASAIGLIAACQCHNAPAADWVIDHGGEVLSILQRAQGCRQ